MKFRPHKLHANPRKRALLPVLREALIATAQPRDDYDLSVLTTGSLAFNLVLKLDRKCASLDGDVRET